MRTAPHDSIRHGTVTLFAAVNYLDGKIFRELVESMETYLAARNLDPVRYEWKSEGKAILEKIERARAARDAARMCNKW